MAERIVRISDDVELCIDELGPSDGPLVLLVMGLGLQPVSYTHLTLPTTPYV